MRYSRMEGRQPPEKPRGNKGAMIFVIVAALAVGVYVISASEAGEFLSDKVVDPVVEAFSPEDENKEQELSDDGAAETENENKKVTYELEEFSMYALQAGVFADKENADKYADELKNKGGAGFVTEFESGYRVFISGYLSKDDAENVKDRLLSEQNMDTGVYELVGDSVKAEVVADSATAELLADSDINGGISELAEISIAKDKGELTEDAAIARLSEMKEESEVTLTALKSIEGDKLAAALAEYYTSFCEVLSAAIDGDEEVVFSSRIKLAYLSAADARGRLGKSING